MKLVSNKPIGAMTAEYLGRPYPRGPLGYSLRVGDKCICHPTEYSQSREPFEVEIVIREINWHSSSQGYSGKWEEVCTNVIDKHSAVMNEYLFSRLEFKSR